MIACLDLDFSLTVFGTKLANCVDGSNVIEPELVFVVPVLLSGFAVGMLNTGLVMLLEIDGSCAKTLAPVCTNGVGAADILCGADSKVVIPDTVLLVLIL